MADTSGTSEEVDHVGRLRAELTLEEKISLVSGAGLWHTRAVPRLGIPAMKVSDGPNGVRGETFGTHTSACFPCGSALGATWDPELVEEVGRALGEQAVSKAVHVLLAPTINLHRTPLAGRNFECYSEDPLLTGVLATAYVRGVQSRGVGATLKHFVANDSEFERHTMSSDIDERPLRELYLKPFEMAVRDASPVAVMSAYNRINGVPASDHRELLTDILRGEWGFDGFVMSDWYGTRDTVASALSGLDLEMPGPPSVFGDRLAAAVAGGQVTESDLDRMVGHLLGVIDRLDVATKVADNTGESSDDRPSHRALIRRAAAEATVLLHNPGDLLPLDAGALTSLAVIGPNSDQAVIMGGGSAQVFPASTVTPLEGIREAVGDRVEIGHEVGCTINQKTPEADVRLLTPTEPPAGDALRSGWTVTYHRKSAPDTDPAAAPVRTSVASRSRFLWMGARVGAIPTGDLMVRLEADLTPPVTGEWTFSLVSAGTSRLWVDDELVVDNTTSWKPGSEFYGAGNDEVTATVHLEAGTQHRVRVEVVAHDGSRFCALRVGAAAPEPADLMERAVALAEQTDAAVVVVGHNADWETEGRDREFLALPGRQVELIERVTAANPRTVVVLNAGAPVEADWVEWTGATICIWYPGQENGRALADVLFGAVTPGGRLPVTFPRRIEDTPSFGNYPGEFDHVRYGEGLLMGYRWYDTRDIEPVFPFGFGLGTSTVEWGRAAVTADPETGDLVVTVPLTNTGPRAAAEVVQVYAHRPRSAVMRPRRELVGFTKVRLAPGESATAEVRVARSDLAYWNPAEHRWAHGSETLELEVARSSRDVVETLATGVEAD